MNIDELTLAVHWTARASALLFSLGLVTPVAFPGRTWTGRSAYLGFMTAHTVHFAFVFLLAQANQGQNMFPGGRSIEESGGWGAVIGIAAFFYTLAFLGLLGRAGEVSSWRRWASLFATTFLGYMFVSTYVPLATTTPWYWLPAGVVTVAVLLNLAHALRGSRLGAFLAECRAGS
jgi:hypothetical protein